MDFVVTEEVVIGDIVTIDILENVITRGRYRNRGGRYRGGSRRHHRRYNFLNEYKFESILNPIFVTENLLKGYNLGEMENIASPYNVQFWPLSTSGENYAINYDFYSQG